VRGTLPPGLRAYARPLPPDIDRRLSPLPGGYRREVVGPDVIVINLRSWVVAGRDPERVPSIDAV